MERNGSVELFSGWMRERISLLVLDVWIESSGGVYRTIGFLSPF